MAAVAITKIEGRPTGTLGAVKASETNPGLQWYTLAALNDADTTTFTAWTGPLPVAVYTRPGTTNEGFCAEFALSGADLVITYQGNNQTAGSFLGIER